jgi:hypothetical protein
MESNYDSNGNLIVRDPVTDEIIGTRVDHISDLDTTPITATPVAPANVKSHMGTIVAVIVFIIAATVAYNWYTGSHTTQMTTTTTQSK